MQAWIEEGASMCVECRATMQDGAAKQRGKLDRALDLDGMFYCHVKMQEGKNTLPEDFSPVGDGPQWSDDG
jgi:hypothetical protein